MKRTFPLLLALSLLAGLIGCGGGETQTQQPDVQDATELLQGVWSRYSEDEKFAVSGGDAESVNMEGPGKFAVDNVEMLDSLLGLPGDMADKVDDVSSLMHMMNANTFTCGAFHVKSDADGEALADALREHILQRQWICGFPDKLVILRAGDYVISFFGNETLVDTFQSKALAAYPMASVACDEPIE